jgi:hypothetical protein
LGAVVGLVATPGTAGKSFKRSHFRASFSKILLAAGVTFFGEDRRLERCRTFLTFGELCLRQSEDGEGRLLMEVKLAFSVEGGGGTLDLADQDVGGSATVDDGVAVNGAAFFWIFDPQESRGAADHWGVAVGIPPIPNDWEYVSPAEFAVLV